MTQTFPTTKAFDLSEDQRNTIIHALHIAADRFAEHRPWESLAAHLDRQAVELRALADRIEAAEYVKLGREVTE